MVINASYEIVKTGEAFEVRKVVAGEVFSTSCHRTERALAGYLVEEGVTGSTSEGLAIVERVIEETKRNSEEHCKSVRLG